MPRKAKRTDQQLKKLINTWFIGHNQRPIVANVSYAESANELCRRVAPRHAWKLFDNREEAASYVRQIAAQLGL
jgi:hypothetical protein